MAFCTECGSKLPDDAVFCPNCGTALKASSPNDSVITETATEQSQAESTATSSDTEKQPEATPVSDTYSTVGTYEAPASGSFSAPAQGTYVPPIQNSYAPPYQGAYAPAQQPQYNAPNSYGYPPAGGVIAPPQKKSKAGLIAVIVVAGVLLLALAGYFIVNAFSSNPYVGYWESVAVDTGDGNISQDFYGTSVVGALDVQINSDYSAYLASSTSSDVIEANWQETDDGISIAAPDDSYSFSYKNKQLILINDGATYYFEKIRDHDINNPTVPHGSLDGSSTAADKGLQSGGTVAGSGDVGGGNYHITVTGAEEFTDVDNEPAIRIYYDFTNNYKGDLSTAAWDALSYYATQDGSNLTETYSNDDKATNVSYNIRPGVTMQCCSEFKYNPEGGNVDFSIYGYDEGEGSGEVSASYVPGSLPGAPAPYVIVPVTDPQWTLNVPAEGALDSFYVAVTDGELIDDANGDPAIRIYYEFTNNSSSSTSLSNELYVFTYQDGISLDTTYATEDSETDSNYYSDVAPGAKVTCSCVYALRNKTSPVEAEVEAYTTATAVGQTYDIAS